MVKKIWEPCRLLVLMTVPTAECLSVLGEIPLLLKIWSQIRWIASKKIVGCHSNLTSNFILLLKNLLGGEKVWIQIAAIYNTWYHVMNKMSDLSIHKWNSHRMQTVSDTERFPCTIYCVYVIYGFNLLYLCSILLYPACKQRQIV